MRFVRRYLFFQYLVFGRGIIWEWLSDDGFWIAYEVSVCDYLEQQVVRGNQFVDLVFLGYNYIVNYSIYTQINKISSFCRSVRRQVGFFYSVIIIIVLLGYIGVVCFCYQCFNSGRIGFVSGRYRYFMINFFAYFVFQYFYRIVIVFGVYQVFVLYNKFLFFGVRFAFRLNIINFWGGVSSFFLGNQFFYRFSFFYLGAQYQFLVSFIVSGVRYFVLWRVVLFIRMFQQVWVFVVIQLEIFV